MKLKAFIKTHLKIANKLLLLELFTIYVRLPYSLSKEFKLLGYSDNKWAKVMELWMIERALLDLSFKREILLSL